MFIDTLPSVTQWGLHVFVNHVSPSHDGTDPVLVTVSTLASDWARDWPPRPPLLSGSLQFCVQGRGSCLYFQLNLRKEVSCCYRMDKHVPLRRIDPAASPPTQQGNMASQDAMLSLPFK